MHHISHEMRHATDIQIKFLQLGLLPIKMIFTPVSSLQLLILQAIHPGEEHETSSSHCLEDLYQFDCLLCVLLSFYHSMFHK